MNKKVEILNILINILGIERDRAKWYVDNVLNDNNLRYVEIDNKIASSLIKASYQMDFHQTTIPVDYISCVATVPNMQGIGLMQGLIKDVILESRESGVPFIAIIPKSRPIYFTYDRMGFATVFYVNEDRFTAKHNFDVGNYFQVSPDYNSFSRLEAMRMGNIYHTQKSYFDEISAISVSRGGVVAVNDGSNSEAMAFVEVDNEIKIKDVLSTDSSAKEAVLYFIRDIYGEKPMVVWDMPDGESVKMRDRGMIRVANVDSVMELIAKVNPDLNIKIGVKDEFIPLNNGKFNIAKGKATRIANNERNVSLDLELTIDVLAKILFSEKRIGELFKIKTMRPYISLMGD